MLLQKLALDIWNRCCPIFQRSQDDKSGGQYAAPLRLQLKEDKALSLADFDQAKQLYVMTKHEHSIGVSSPAMRIRDFLNY